LVELFQYLLLAAMAEVVLEGEREEAAAAEA
jgi:hypothetical protein